jgi:hypothetical protein
MLFTTLAALAIAAAPAPAVSCQAPIHTGTFRITAVTRDSSTAKIGMILLENVEGCLEASVVTDEGGPAIIDHVVLKDDTLTGSLRMHRGDARITLRFTAAGLEGTIGEGKTEWKLAGRRTSDPYVRVGAAK